VKASPAAVGSFVLGGLTLAVLAILFFGGLRLFTPSLRAVVFFPTSVAGLTVGAPVTFRGVQVGSVRKIALRLNVADRSSIIPTFLELDSDRISWVDTRRCIRSAPMSAVHSATSTAWRSTRQQVALSGRELQRVLASAQRTAQTAETLVASLNSIAAPRSEMRGDLEAALRDLAASASSLRSFTRELERSPLSALRGR